MTDRDPRDRLQALRLTSERIASNLLELEGDETVAMLDASGLRGLTAERWSDARLRLAGLFAAHTALKDLIDRAADLLARSRLLTGDRLDELEALLAGPSIVVSDTTLRLPERGLLAESRRVVRRTPDELITEMSSEFDVVRSVVVGVAHVWDIVIPQLRSEREREVALAALAADIGIDCPDLVAAGAALRGLSAVALSDPLAIDSNRLGEIVTAFDNVEHELAELRALQTGWPDRVAGARDLLTRAHRAADACAEAAAHANLRISLDEPIAPVAIPSELVTSLDAAIAVGDEDRLSGGAALLVWREAITNRMEQAEAVTVRCRRLIDERDELRARLEIYAVKADRLRMLEHTEAVNAFEAARRSLYTAPTDLQLAANLVATYQALIADGRGA